MRSIMGTSGARSMTTCMKHTSPATNTTNLATTSCADTPCGALSFPSRDRVGFRTRIWSSLVSYFRPPRDALHSGFRPIPSLGLPRYEYVRL